MDPDSRERAENKILLLYFLRMVGIPVSNMQLTRFMLENRFMNYFLLQQGIYELESDRLITAESRDGVGYFSISDEGIRMLEMFMDLLPAGIRKSLDEAADSLRPAFRQEASITAGSILVNEHEYKVELKVAENGKPLIEINLSVGSRDDARIICDNWRDCAKEIYPSIISVLLGR